MQNATRITRSYQRILIILRFMTMNGKTKSKITKKTDKFFDFMQFKFIKMVTIYTIQRKMLARVWFHTNAITKKQLKIHDKKTLAFAY